MVDLRYLEKTGGFPKVKLMISTSCATICNEALDIFASLFPNAVLLGYGKSAPKKGEKIRNKFEKTLKGLSIPLILTDKSDIQTIISAWKKTIESRHKTKYDAKLRRPSFFMNGTCHYWTGEEWITLPRNDPDNACQRKGDYRDQYPAPLPAGSGSP